MDGVINGANAFYLLEQRFDKIPASVRVNIIDVIGKEQKQTVSKDIMSKI